MDDLESGQLDDYLEEIKDYLFVCEERFERQENAGSAATKKIEEAGFAFEKKKEVSRHFQTRVGIVAAATGTAGVGLIASGVITTFFIPPVGVVLINTGVVGSAAAAGLTTGAGYTQAQINIYINACRFVIDLDEKLKEAMSTAAGMREKIHRINTAGDGIGKLKKKAVEENAKMENIKYTLQRVQKKMSKLSEDSTEIMKELASVSKRVA